MVTLTVVDAKKRFSEILRRAGEGERFVVTNHGRPVAQIVPPAVTSVEDRRAAVQRIRELRKGQTLGGLSFKELRDDGRP